MNLAPPQWDVLGVGSTAVDQFLVVDGYPPPDCKTRIVKSQRECGGLTATALVAAARLGGRCAYGGQLGLDEASQFVAQALSSEGIDLGPVQWRTQAAPVQSTIIVDRLTGTRNVFTHHPGEIGPGPDGPTEAHIVNAAVILIDHHGGAHTLRVVKQAHALGVPVVADFERDTGLQWRQCLELVNHLILSLPFAMALTGANTPESALNSLWNLNRATVVVTHGGEGSWYRDHLGERGHVPAREVDVIDSTGCGDAFHGAYAWALAQGWKIQRRLAIATAVAGTQATVEGGQSGLPRWEHPEDFL